MKRSYILPVLLAIGFLLPGEATAQQAQFPIVKDFGGIYEVKDAVNPDPNIEYKIVIDLKAPQGNNENLNRGLQNVARMMNLHGLGGVKSENLNVVVVVHGGATVSILNNEGYQRKHGTYNPNLELMDALKEAGAEIYVCGQSLLSRGYKQEEVYAEVDIGLSMLTVVSTYMHKGYKQFVF